MRVLQIVKLLLDYARPRLHFVSLLIIQYIKPLYVFLPRLCIFLIFFAKKIFRLTTIDDIQQQYKESKITIRYMYHLATATSNDDSTEQA